MAGMVRLGKSEVLDQFGIVCFRVRFLVGYPCGALLIAAPLQTTAGYCRSKVCERNQQKLIFFSAHSFRVRLNS